MLKIYTILWASKTTWKLNIKYILDGILNSLSLKMLQRKAVVWLTGEWCIHVSVYSLQHCSWVLLWRESWDDRKDTPTWPGREIYFWVSSFGEMKKEACWPELWREKWTFNPACRCTSRARSSCKHRSSIAIISKAPGTWAPQPFS